jgi:hypothetical protein
VTSDGVDGDGVGGDDQSNRDGHVHRIDERFERVRWATRNGWGPDPRGRLHCLRRPHEGAKFVDVGRDGTPPPGRAMSSAVPLQLWSGSGLARLPGAETATMATKKKRAKTPKKPSSRAATAPNTPKKKTRTNPAKKQAAKKKPKQAAKKQAAPKTKKTAKTPAVPRPRTFAEKLRDANARIDVHGDDMENEADGAGQAGERDVGEAEEVEGDADGTSEQE